MNTSSPHARLAAALSSIPDDLVAQTLLEGMRATVISRAGVLEPDSRTRIAAANLIIAYKVGRPHISEGPPAEPQKDAESDDDELVEVMGRSPAMFEFMEKRHADLMERALKRRAEMAAETAATKAAEINWMFDKAKEMGYDSPDELAAADHEGFQSLDLQWQEEHPSDEANGKAGTPPVDVPGGGSPSPDGEGHGGGESAGVKPPPVSKMDIKRSSAAT